jgi:hypothetical protein
MAQELVQELVQELAQELVQELAQELVQELAQELVQELARELVQEDLMESRGRGADLEVAGGRYEVYWRNFYFSKKSTKLLSRGEPL